MLCQGCSFNPTHTHSWAGKQSAPQLWSTACHCHGPLLPTDIIPKGKLLAHATDIHCWQQGSPHHRSNNPYWTWMPDHTGVSCLEFLGSKKSALLQWIAQWYIYNVWYSRESGREYNPLQESTVLISAHSSICSPALSWIMAILWDLQPCNGTLAMFLKKSAGLGMRP